MTDPTLKKIIVQEGEKAIEKIEAVFQQEPHKEYHSKEQLEEIKANLERKIVFIDKQLALFK